MTHLIGLFQHVDQVVGFGGVLVGEQRVRGACVVRTTGATDAVHVVLRVVWIVVVDDELDVFNVWSWSLSSSRAISINIHRHLQNIIWFSDLVK